MCWWLVGFAKALPRVGNGNVCIYILEKKKEGINRKLGVGWGAEGCPNPRGTKAVEGEGGFGPSQTIPW